MTDECNELRPTRVQLRRVKGWRKPANAIVVSRPSKWGNPFKIGGQVSANQAVERFRMRWAAHLAHEPIWAHRQLAELRGHDLACWCSLDAPCHADVLLDLANRPTR